MFYVMFLNKNVIMQWSDVMWNVTQEKMRLPRNKFFKMVTWDDDEEGEDVQPNDSLFRRKKWRPIQHSHRRHS